ncbi:MAG: transglycosylase domain-containing protein [Erysipelotrichaceae bacterium]|nr:transglycosylase domain-containing protein [Erysipelotrichaceae bacterium]
MKKILKWILILLIAAGAFVCGAFLFRGWRDSKTVEQSAPLEQICQTVMSSENYVPYDQLPKDLVNATIAVEDARYYTHGAVDFFSAARAVASQVLPYLQKSGGSTIAQQTVKNLYQYYSGGLEWKGAELFLAIKLEKLYTKDEILALYVNIINYGDDYTGIREAANGYFQCAPIQLNMEECTLLAGIPQSPANMQLSNHFDAAKAKQKIVLEAMVRSEYITQQQADEIYARPIWYVVYGAWRQGLA